VTGRRAFRVDALLGQREVVVKGLSRLVSSVDVLTGASAEPDGSILLVLDAAGLLARAERTVGATIPQPAQPNGPTRDRARVLVVDDALTVRELQRSVLHQAGYDVDVAADASEAMACLRDRPFDVVLTDVEMPAVDGFALTEAIKADPTLRDTAVVLLTSRSSETDRRRGLEAGASAYLLKSAFDETALLDTVARLGGDRR
jgi:two-component system chemotaxis sensor kinase CheA